MPQVSKMHTIHQSPMYLLMCVAPRSTPLPPPSPVANRLAGTEHHTRMCESNIFFPTRRSLIVDIVSTVHAFVSSAFFPPSQLQSYFFFALCKRYIQS